MSQFAFCFRQNPLESDLVKESAALKSMKTVKEKEIEKIERKGKTLKANMNKLAKEIDNEKKQLLTREQVLFWY